MTTLPDLPRADLALARRLERAEGMANAAFVEARRETHPHVGAAWIDAAGTYAMFDGPDSPLTQTFGLGLFEPCIDAELDRIESFFAERGAATFHEVCSLADRDTMSVLAARGYSPVESSVVLIRSTVATEAPPASSVRVRAIHEGEASTWARVGARAWGNEAPELGAFVEELGSVMARSNGVTCFLADLDGEPVASATLNIQNSVALFAGASTVLEARRRGAQRALLDARLAFAASQGIELAMIVTQPGSASQRNAERHGFRAVYTRAKWRRS